MALIAREINDVAGEIDSVTSSGTAPSTTVSTAATTPGSAIDTKEEVGDLHEDAQLLSSSLSFCFLYIYTFYYQFNLYFLFCFKLYFKIRILYITRHILYFLPYQQGNKANLLVDGRHLTTHLQMHTGMLFESNGFVLKAEGGVS